MHQTIDLKKDKLTFTLYKVNEEVCSLTLLGLHIFFNILDQPKLQIIWLRQISKKGLNKLAEVTLENTISTVEPGSYFNYTFNRSNK